MKKAAFNFRTPPPLIGITRYIEAERSYGVQMLMGIKMPNETYMIEMTTRHVSGSNDVILFPEDTFTAEQTRQIIDKLDKDWLKNKKEKDFVLQGPALQRLLSSEEWAPNLSAPTVKAFSS